VSYDAGVLEMLRDLVAHKGYADAAMLAAVRRCDGAGADADLVALLQHMLIANRFWLLSSADLPFVFENESQPLASLDAVIARFRATHEHECDCSRRRPTHISRGRSTRLSSLAAAAPWRRG